MSAAPGALAHALPAAELVARSARRLRRRLPPHVDVRDLIQAAWLRLLCRDTAADAARSADHQAAHLAAHVRGAMIDELRSVDAVLRDAMAAADDDTQARIEAMPCTETRPDHAAELAESLRVLHAAVCELHHPLRLVMLHQLAEVPAVTTAATLRVDPSRVSQLRADALRLLRVRLARPFGVMPAR